MQDLDRRRPGDPDRCARLRALRQALRLTQDDVATRSGLARTRVNKLENGWEVGGKHAVHVALARGLGVSAEDLDAVLAGSKKPETVARRAREARA